MNGDGRATHTSARIATGSITAQSGIIVLATHTPARIATANTLFSCGGSSVLKTFSATVYITIRRYDTEFCSLIVFCLTNSTINSSIRQIGTCPIPYFLEFIQIIFCERMGFLCLLNVRTGPISVVFYCVSHSETAQIFNCRIFQFFFFQSFNFKVMKYFEFFKVFLA